MSEWPSCWVGRAVLGAGCALGVMSARPGRMNDLIVAHRLFECRGLSACGGGGHRLQLSCCAILLLRDSLVVQFSCYPLLLLPTSLVALPSPLPPAFPPPDLDGDGPGSDDNDGSVDVSYPGIIAGDVPVGWWRLDEDGPTASIALDSSSLGLFGSYFAFGPPNFEARVGVPGAILTDNSTAAR